MLWCRLFAESSPQALPHGKFSMRLAKHQNIGLFLWQLESDRQNETGHYFAYVITE
jgi:hypothetical protein